jgi:HoxN/HupN/NixA family high-affinity nickel-transporter
MLREKRSLFTSFQKGAISVYVLLGSGSIAAWVWAFLVFRNDVVLLGTAFLAFSLGLRHGVDADHIAAIDNVTRKLMHEHKRPLSVGLFFALGHSSVVILASFAVFATASAVEHQLIGIKGIVEVISTSVSALFLVAIALLNLLVFRDVYETFKRAKETGNCIDKDMNLQGLHGGVLTRLFKPVFRVTSKPWHMYPLGFLFALGFETASEVALFGISATAAGKGLSISSMMVFPVVFAVGMILVDTTDDGWFTIIAPILMAAPGYFGGNLSFGELMVVVGAFMQVQQALRWFIDNFSSIADWRATLLRIASFRETMVTMDRLGAAENRIEFIEPAGDKERAGFEDFRNDRWTF